MVMRYFRKSQPVAETEGPGTEDSSQLEASEPATTQSDVKTPDAKTEILDGPSKGPENPVLTDEDELFLRQVVSEEEPAPPLPPRLGSAGSDSEEISASKDSVSTESKSKSRWKSKWDEYRLSRDRHATADDLMSAAEGIKAGADTPSDESDSEPTKEKREVKSIMDRLDLSSINDKVVGLSDDTQKLLNSFNQVLKDLINGVPTAYDDLEKLLTERNAQIDKLYNGLPSFLQKLIKTIPARAYAAFAPQLAAAMATTKDQETQGSADESKDGKNKGKTSGPPIPSLKALVKSKGAVLAMLRSIVTFLETRFPMLLTGTNVAMSLAVFVLLFVFWYCHKRGRETRLAREQAESLDNKTDDQERGQADSQISNPEADDELQKKVDEMADEIEKKP